MLCLLHSFSTAHVTNYYKLSDLKQDKFTILQFGEFEDPQNGFKMGLTELKSMCQQGCFPS